MNSTVTVSGMQVHTVVSDNLLVAESTEGTGHVADSNFRTAINQSVHGVLQPVSTITAANNSFFYTYDATATGAKNLDTSVEPYKAVVSDSSAANYRKVVNGDETYDAFKDYVFELKAINSNLDAAKQIRLTRLNLLYDGNTADVTNAYRVAIFTQKLDSTYTAIGNDEAAKMIYSVDGATYFDGKAVDSTTTKAAINASIYNTALPITVAAGQTEYYKVTVRIWLEGEDTECYTTKFVPLTNDWALDLKFDLVNTSESDASKAAVTHIGSAVSILANAVTATGATATLNASVDAAGEALANGEKILSLQWYLHDLGGTDVLQTGATSATFTRTASGTGSYYCAITTEKGNVYNTNMVKLTVEP